MKNLFLGLALFIGLQSTALAQTCSSGCSKDYVGALIFCDTSPFPNGCASIAYCTYIMCINHACGGEPMPLPMDCNQAKNLQLKSTDLICSR